MKLLSYKLETIFKVHFQLNSRNKLQVSQMSQKTVFFNQLWFSRNVINSFHVVENFRLLIKTKVCLKHRECGYMTKT